MATRDRAREHRSAAFARGVRAGVTSDALGLMVAAAELGRERGVAFEVGCCRLAARRLALVDLLDGEPTRVIAALRRVNSALVRASRLQAVSVAEGGATSSEALTALLLEMGVV